MRSSISPAILAPLALALLAVVAPARQSSDPPPRSVRIALQMLEQQRARTTVAAYELLEQSGHRAAFEGLREILVDELRPLLMRGRAVRHLAGFASSSELVEGVLRTLAETAIDAPELGLRRLAVDELAEAGEVAARYLELVVDHGSDPASRARALDHHVALAPDQDWYVTLLIGVGRQLRWDLLDRELTPVGVELRRTAFAAVVESLSAEQLLELLEARDEELRLSALETLCERGHPEAPALTAERYRDATLTAAERLTAGALHVRYADDDFVSELIAAASAEDVESDTRERVGRTVAPFLTIRQTTELLRQVDRASLGARTVAASALRGNQSTRFRKTLARMLEDEDPDLRRLAIEELGAWVGEQEVLDALLGRLADDELDFGEGAPILRTAQRVAGERPDWPATLRSMLEHPAADVRGEALRLLAARAPDDADALAILSGSLAADDWTRRSTAVELLVRRRGPTALETLIAGLEGLEGRDLQVVADGLWRISGLQLGTRAQAWQGWWEQAGQTFEPLDETETELLLEERRLEQESGTRATFFSLRVESSRVCFVVDISGSMDELTSWARSDRDDGGVARDTRLDVAKAELSSALSALAEGTLFNVIVFSDDAEAWSRTLEPANDTTRRKALEFIDRQRAGGGTNLYAALRLAFSDQRLDSLILLSDGEPSMGKLRDPDAILNAIERWNEGRGVRLDCVAIGIQLELLEDLAKRCGGTCLSLR